MPGLSTPQTAVLQIVENAVPKESNTDRVEAALNAILADQEQKPRQRVAHA